MKFAHWETRSIFFLIFLIHFFTLSSGYETHEFIDSSSIYQIYDTKTYSDGTVLLHMINDNAVNCSKPELYLRLIYSNGTVNSLNIPARQIPTFNFCQITNDIVYQLYIKVWPLEPNFIYVTYLNSSGIDASVYGLLINWNGKILSNSFIDKATIGLNGTVSPPGSLYYSKGDGNNGFLYARKQNMSDIIWSYFTFPTSQNKYSIKLLRKGVIKGRRAKDVKFFGFSHFTKGFYLILAKSFNHPNVYSLDLANVNLRVETYFINANDTRDPVPNVIYQSPVFNLKISSLACGLDYKGGGISCLLYLAISETLKNLFGVRIMFRSNGATGIVEEVPALDITGNPELRLKSLTTGGYLLTAHVHLRDSQEIYGYILNATGHIQDSWNLPQPITITARGQAFDILPNNTLVAVTKYAKNNYTVITSDFPKSPMKGDLGYFNPLIISTYPPLNGSIPLKTTKINITYSEPIAISSQNISIYQYFNAKGSYLLRQTYPASAGFTKLSKDNKTLIISVFDSTFNKPNSSYHIIVESDAVRLKDSGEPVLGIQNNVWNVTTENRTVASILIARRPVIAFVRLSPEGTEKFNSLDEKGKGNFTDNLGKELAFIVPIGEKSIVPLHRYQKDQRTKEKRMLIPFKIGPSNNNTANATATADNESPEDIMNDLQALISHGGLTLVGNLDHTKTLDTSYGFVRKRDIFRDNRFQLILFVAYIISLFLLILMVFYLNRQANIGVVLKFIIALVTFVFFTMYTYENSRDVEKLALASVLLLILPFAIKLSLGLFIISRESKSNQAFHDWINEHTILAFFFAFLSGVDLDGITVLSSGIEESLHAPLSSKASNWINTIEIIGFFLKDLLQLAVLILYYKLVLDYGIVPFFATVSLIILIIYVIIWRFFRVCVWCFKEKEKDRGIRVSEDEPSEDVPASAGSSLWKIFSPKVRTGVSNGDSSKDPPSSSGSSFWKKIFPSTKVMAAGSGASHGSRVGSLLEKIGLGRLLRIFRRSHITTTTVVDEYGNIVGELSTTTTTTPHEEMITSISSQHGGTSTTTISPQHGGVTTTTISSQPGGAKTTTSSQSGGATTTITSQHGGTTTITSGGITTTSSQRGGLTSPQRIIRREGDTEYETIITEERREGEGTEGEEIVEQKIIEYVVEEEVEEVEEEVEKKDDK